MTALNEDLLKKFLKTAVKRLKGEWVLLGGTLLPYLGCNHRSTTDIDFVPIQASSNQQTLELMKISEDLKLPIETVNMAALYFLQKIPEYKKHLVVLEETKTCTVFRPDIFLYLSLKIGRLSESDLLDCLEMLKLEKDELPKGDLKKITTHIEREIEHSADEHRKNRLSRLLKEIL